MKKAVIVDSNYGSVALSDQEWLQEKLLENGIELELFHCAGEDEIIACAADADMILGTGNPPITERVLTALPNLKGVLRFGIGVNSVDLEAATRLNKLVLFMPGFCIRELAAHAAAMILALDRNVVYYDSHIRKGEWPKAKYYRPQTVGGMKIGLLGFGGSAQELYKIFRFGFGCEILAYDPYFPDAAKENFEVRFTDFDELIREADVVSLHLPLTKETTHLINRDVLHRMKNTATLINISRGGLIDQEALAEALKTGEIRFAGLDVYEQEPLVADSPLRELDNVVLTCHSAFYGDESSRRQLDWAFEMTRDMLNDRKVVRRRVANPAVLTALDNTYSFV